MMGKWLQLLKKVAPRVSRVAVIFNPDTAPYAPLFNREIEAAAPSLGMTVKLAPVHDDATIEEAIASQGREPGGSLLTLPDSFNATHRDAIIAAASRLSLPLMGLIDIFPRAGALMSYGIDPVDLYAQAASYIDRILKGASPADLPVQQPTKFSLVINLKTARALGLTVPPSMLDLADEVIECGDAGSSLLSPQRRYGRSPGTPSSRSGWAMWACWYIGPRRTRSLRQASRLLRRRWGVSGGSRVRISESTGAFPGAIRPSSRLIRRSSSA